LKSGFILCVAGGIKVFQKLFSRKAATTQRLEISFYSLRRSRFARDIAVDQG
jgi:hypothetical protein